MFTRKLTMSLTAGAAAIAVAVGAFAIGNSSSSNTASGAATATPPAQTGPGARGGHQAPPAGQGPQNWRPGTGTIITGAAADKAKAAAVARYPQGTVNRVLKLSDGSYAVHRIGPGTNGQHHIFVSPDFKVTGTS
jgi:hypothetical protein